ncbi:MAG: hypothetical protein WBX01_16690 [Nitrososphaeraceae archaeon]
MHAISKKIDGRNACMCLNSPAAYPGNIASFLFRIEGVKRRLNFVILQPVNKGKGGRKGFGDI